MRLALLCLLMAGCYRSPGRLTSTEADAAVEGAFEALSPLFKTMGPVAPVVAHWFANGPHSLIGLKDQNLGCNASIQCFGSASPRACGVILGTECGGGAFSVLDEGGRLLFCWGEDGYGNREAMSGEVWGATTATPVAGGGLQLDQTLFWSSTIEPELDLRGPCSRPAFNVSQLPANAHGLMGPAQVLFSPSVGATPTPTGIGVNFSLISAQLSWLQPLDLFDPWLVADKSDSDMDPCLESDCPWWLLEPNDLVFDISKETIDGALGLTFFTPEEDHAALFFEERHPVQVTDGKNLYQVDVP